MGFMQRGFAYGNRRGFAPPSEVIETLNVRSTVLDGGIAKADDPDYMITHDHSQGGHSHPASIFVGQQLPVAPANFRICRLCLMFDTSSIPPVFTVYSAILEFKCAGFDWSDQDFLITLVDGSVCATVMVDPDYGNLLPQVFSGGNQIDTALGWVAGTTKTITLNATGMLWIVSGTTKLALRSDRDINAIAPVGQERVDLLSGHGANPEADRPLLTVVYGH